MHATLMPNMGDIKELEDKLRAMTIDINSDAAVGLLLMDGGRASVLVRHSGRGDRRGGGRPGG